MFCSAYRWAKDSALGLAFGVQIARVTPSRFYNPLVTSGSHKEGFRRSGSPSRHPNGGKL